MHNLLEHVGEWLPSIADDAKRYTLIYMDENSGPYDANDILDILGTVEPNNPQMIERMFQNDWSGEQKVSAREAKRQIRGHLAAYIIKTINNENGRIIEYPTFNVFISVGPNQVEVTAFEPKAKVTNIPIGSLDFSQSL
jgi:hypothetical protein